MSTQNEGTCNSKFDNVTNSGGYAHIPGGTGTMRVELLLTLCLLCFFVAVAAFGSYTRNTCPLAPGDVVQNATGHRIGTIQMIRQTDEAQTRNCHVAIIYTDRTLEYWLPALNFKKLSDTGALD